MDNGINLKRMKLRNNASILAENPKLSFQSIGPSLNQICGSGDVKYIQWRPHYLLFIWNISHTKGSEIPKTSWKIAPASLVKSSAQSL